LSAAAACAVRVGAERRSDRSAFPPGARLARLVLLLLPPLQAGVRLVHGVSRRVAGRGVVQVEDLERWQRAAPQPRGQVSAASIGAYTASIVAAWLAGMSDRERRLSAGRAPLLSLEARRAQLSSVIWVPLRLSMRSFASTAGASAAGGATRAARPPCRLTGCQRD